MTFRQLINKVLIRLREDTITVDWTGDIDSSSELTDYQKLIGGLVNDAKKEVESKHDWLSLVQVSYAPLQHGTHTYKFNDIEIREGIRIQSIEMAETGTILEQIRKPASRKKIDEKGKEPRYYSIERQFLHYIFANEPHLQIRVYPQPSENDLNNMMVVSTIETQPALSLHTDVLFIPSQPIILGALARAIAERGEDGGTQSSAVALEAVDSLNQAIIMDQGNAEDEIDWYV